MGCAGSYPSPDSAASCYLVEAPGPDSEPTRLVLDLGSGALGQLQRYVDPRVLDAVLLSHLHPDHCLDLTALFVLRRYHPGGPAGPRVPVYGPAGTAPRLAAAYQAGRLDIGAGVEALAGELDIREWVAGTPIEVGGLRVLPVAVRHPVPTFGMRVSWRSPAGREVVLAYTGDTDTCPGLVELATGADLLLAEAAFVEGRDDAIRGLHLTGRRAGQAAAAGGAGRLVLTHVPAWNDPAAAPAEAAAVYPGPIEVAAPGLCWQLG